jgi:HSP20 family molecular chaperone IbpA
MNKFLLSVFSLSLLMSTTGVLAWQQPERYHIPYYSGDSHLYMAEQPYGYRQGVSYRQGVRIEKARDADGYLLRIYTKGISPEDITVSTARGRIRLEIATLASKNWRDRQQTARAISYGRFSRTLSLPRDADAAGLVTRTMDGMLEIRIPRR